MVTSRRHHQSWRWWRRPCTLRVVFVLLCLVVFVSMILQGRRAARSQDKDRRDGEDVHRGMGDPRNHHHHGNQSSYHGDSTDEKLSIAMGCAITSEGFTDLLPGTAAYRLPFLRSMLPSFCNTASGGYAYHFYVSFDHTDRFLTRRDSLHAFNEVFRRLIEERCPRGSAYSLHFVEVNYDRKPAWAQNDAMMEAYLDDRDYYYRVNDDIILQTPGWTELFIDALRNSTPVNVGVVGPTHTGGNEEILTQDFVHKTHIDVFGFYYPRLFGDWWADDWMTMVYQEQGRSTKHPGVTILHTQERGTRYKPHMSREQYLFKQVEQDKQVLNRYLEAAPRSADGTKVISMSLWGHDARYTFGCLRNAQLTPVVFPAWTLRVYVERARSDGLTRFSPVPQRILDKLYKLGAAIVPVDPHQVSVAPMMWRFLVADDPEIKWFIVRDADSRLMDRDAAAVQAWMEAGTAAHCERDHPSHAGYSLSGGLWGGQPKLLKQLISMEWEGLMKGVGTGYGDDMNFLGQVIWPRVQSNILCHDSISCTRYPNSSPFPTARRGTEHAGQVYDAFGNAREEDIELLLNAGMPAECSDTAPLGGEVEGKRAKFTIWNMDYHTSYIRGLKQLLGGDDDVDFIVKSLSERCHVIDGCPDDLKVITSENAMELTPQLINEFTDTYQNSSEMRRVSHFLCFYPASMCELYQNLNKSVIIVATTRYEQGRVTKARWQQWNKLLTTYGKSHKNIIATSNKYDQQYMQYFTGYKPLIIPSFCGYTKTKYAPEKVSFVLYPLSNLTIEKQLMSRLQEAIIKRNISIQIRTVRNLYPKAFSFKDIAKHKGVIFIPDDVTSPSLCELYAMRIPLFIPDLDFLIKMHMSGSVLSKLTFNSVRRSHGESVTGSALSAKLNATDPNADWSADSLRQWLPLADYYQWPHIVYFSSHTTLLDKLDSVDLDVVTEDMRQQNTKLKEAIHEQWKVLLNNTLVLH